VGAYANTQPGQDRPIAAPLMLPTLHNPCSEDMIGRPFRCSIAEPWAFMATSSAALLAPQTIIAPNSVSASFASARQPKAIAIGSAHPNVTRRLP